MNAVNLLLIHLSDEWLQYDDTACVLCQLQNIVNIQDEKNLELLNLEEMKNNIMYRSEVTEDHKVHNLRWSSSMKKNVG